MTRSTGTSSLRGAPNDAPREHYLTDALGSVTRTVEKAIGQTRTEELVVMLDTFKPLWMTEESLKIEDPSYWESWKTH